MNERVAAREAAFRVRVPDSDLKDLRQRLKRARVSHDFANIDWWYGPNGDYVTSLLDYWLQDYDWRDAEARINAFDHFRVDLHGIPIHYMRRLGAEPNPIPLIVTHGWPYCFWDLERIVDPLADPRRHGGDSADSFDVIIPSLPGYGYSSPLRRPVDWIETADIWHELMTRVLGYSMYAAAGADWGALIAAQLGHKYHHRVQGIHVTGLYMLDMWNCDRPWNMFEPDQLDGPLHHARLAYERKYAAHMPVQVINPQGLSYAMNDSPVGLLAYLVGERWNYSDHDCNLEDVVSREHLITTTMIYWLTETFGTSVRYYADAARSRWRPSHDRIPIVQSLTGFSSFEGVQMSYLGRENPAEVVRNDPMVNWYKVHYTNHWRDGGHFPYQEVPDSVVHDIRATFRDQRGERSRLM